MKIRITYGRDGWYKDKVGEVYETIDGRNLGFSKYPPGTPGYYVDHPDNVFNKRIKYVEAGDFEIVSEAEVAVMEAKAEDVINSPAHYTQAKFETIEVIEEWTKGYDDGFVSYCVGNALKYLSRAPYKHGEPTDDLRKAAKYIEFALDSLAKEDEE